MKFIEKNRRYRMFTNRESITCFKIYHITLVFNVYLESSTFIAFFRYLILYNPNSYNIERANKVSMVFPV